MPGAGISMDLDAPVSAGIFFVCMIPTFLLACIGCAVNTCVYRERARDVEALRAILVEAPPSTPLPSAPFALDPAPANAYQPLCDD